MADWDVIVVGGGNAALCAALSAKETAKRVLVLERAPEAEAGGNSRFTAGLMRIVYNGADDLGRLIELSREEIERTDFGTYTADQFLDDMALVTEYRCDPDLTEILVKESFPTALWMRKQGLRFTAAWGRQAFKIEGRFKFWGGLTLEAVGGGPGLVESLTRIALRRGIEIWYSARAVSLLADDAGVHGVRVKREGKTLDAGARAVVLAAGGFQANPEWRTRYLGPGWELAKVRGTRFNTGDAIHMALEVGAAPVGNWSGCHAVAWDRNAPEFGDLAVGDQFQKHSYPWGIYINAEGKRFVDEGADFRNYTYAKYGRVILHQPGQFAWQIFDAKVKGQLRDEYRIKQVTRVTANTLEELVKKLDDVNADAALAEIRAYNKAVRREIGKSVEESRRDVDTEQDRCPRGKACLYNQEERFRHCIPKDDDHEQIRREKQTRPQAQPQSSARYSHRLEPRSDEGHRCGNERNPGGRVRALHEDQELPLAHEWTALSRLPFAPGRASRPALCDDRPHCRARP